MLYPFPCHDLTISFVLEFFWLALQELSITSDEALSLDELPKRAVVLGGGFVYICICLVF